MYTQSFSLFVSDSVGSVSANYIAPEEPRCIMTLKPCANRSQQLHSWDWRA